MLQIEASRFSFVLGFLYVLRRYESVRHSLSEMSGREFCRDDGMAITGGLLDVALTLGEAEYLIEDLSSVLQR